MIIYQKDNSVFHDLLLTSDNRRKQLTRGNNTETHENVGTTAKHMQAQ